MLISKSDNKIVLQPVPSFTDKLAGVTAGSFGQSAEEVQERLDRGFAPFSELKSTSARP